MDTAFPHHSITKICKAALAAELITYDSSTKMTQPHDSTPQLFQPKKRRSNAFKYPGRALLSVQFTTSLTSFSELTKADLHKPHKLSDTVKIRLSKSIKYSNFKLIENFKNLIFFPNFQTPNLQVCLKLKGKKKEKKGTHKNSNQINL